MCRGSRWLRAIGSFFASKPPTRCSIATRQRNFLARSKRRRCPKLRIRHLVSLSLLLIAGGVSIGCRQDMQDQPKYIPLRPDSFFADGRSARPLPEGTVARGLLRADKVFYTGKLGNDFIDRI